MSDSRCHVEDYYKDLLHHLQGDGRDVAVSERFSAVATNADRVELAYELLEEYRLFPALIDDFKSDRRAERFRREGNALYKKREIFGAIESYTRGVCCASGGSEELALAYANRSAALFEKGFYEECLVDITRALDCNCPAASKVKLLARRAKATLMKPKQIVQAHHQPLPEIPKEEQNGSIECATRSIELRCTEGLGRHVVAVKDIEIGEIIAVEKPFCFVLTKDYLTHCHECLKLCYNLLPCSNCTETLYCSENCAAMAQKYHKHECKVVKTIRALNFDTMKILPMKIALITRHLYQQILNSNLETNGTYRSDRYTEIHSLAANTEQRKIADVFKRAVCAAVSFHLIKTHANFFETETDEIAFKELVLLHMQTAPCNFHSITEIKKNREEIYESDDIAAGAFSFLSMFNHSCNPNVVRQSFGPALVLRAIRSIPAGEQLFDNYGYHYAVMPKAERQSDLKKQYFFDCSCEACRNDWPLFEQLQCIDVNGDNPCLDDLMKGDLFSAQRVLPMILPKMKELERVQPNKNFAEKQEIIKQCFALLGNLKRDN